MSLDYFSIVYISIIRVRVLSAVSLDIEENESKDFNEKDPTPYLFRRNFATGLYIHDLTIEECQYLMGHEIENLSFRRHDFFDENMLFRMAEKLGFTTK